MLERTVDGRRVEVEHEVASLEGPLVRDEGHHYWSVGLVVPRGGFIAGSEYAATAWYDGLLVGEVLLRVDDRHLSPRVAVAGPATLVAESLEHSRREVRSGSACSTEIDTAEVRIALELPPELEPWRDVFLYTVHVDGNRIWRLTTSHCRPVPVGTSATGKGTELLVASCSPPHPSARYVGNPDDVLSEGHHTIVMTAWWPGSSETISATAQIELRCPDPGFNSSGSPDSRQR